MKICVVTPRYAISGVPLAQVRFARALANAGHQVDLIIGRADPHLTIPLLRDVNTIVLDRPNVRSMIGPLWHYLRSKKPDIIFSAEDHLNTIVLLTAILARSRAKISGSSRVTPFDTYSSKPFTKRWLLKQAARALNWRADALTCVSQDMVQQYRQLFPRETRLCVYNIVDDADARAKLREPVEEPWLERNHELPLVVGAGTLNPWKGFPDLIRAVAMLRDRKRPVRLLILGEGPMHVELETLIAELGMTDLVRLPGYKANPLSYFARAQAFVLSSHVEGMPNVLVEAMLAGCTPVSTDCPTGPRELLQDGRYGYLVPAHDPSALAAGIECALEQPIPPETLAEAVRPFEERAVLQRHFETLGLVAGV
jgi:glycosyltransferase involved in cell wall biosynthesis